MPSTDERPGEPGPIEKEYVDIIRSDIKTDKKFIEDTGLPAKILYYCQDCKKLVKAKRIGKKFQFSCVECNKNNVSFGTEKALTSYYKIPEAKTEMKN